MRRIDVTVKILITILLQMLCMSSTEAQGTPSEALSAESRAEESVGRKPVKPIVQSITLEYDSYDYVYHCLDNPRFSCKLYAPYADKISILFTERDADVVPDDEHLFFSFDHRLPVVPVNEEFTVINEWCGINQKICFYGYNKYGFSEYSDTILINDLIEDPEILADLNQASGIVHTTGDIDMTDILDFCHGEIIIKSGYIKDLTVYDSTGHEAISSHAPHKGNRFHIGKGFYIVKLKLGNRHLIKKVIL